eukprot:scaffold1466_cov159-Amphora_coffeaeformis.AAC.3
MRHDGIQNLNVSVDNTKDNSITEPLAAAAATVADSFPERALSTNDVKEEMDDEKEEEETPVIAPAAALELWKETLYKKSALKSNELTWIACYNFERTREGPSSFVPSN